MTIQEIAEAVEKLEEDKAVALVTDALNEGADPQEILQEGIVKGLRVVGDKFEKGEYFLLELQEGGDMADRLIPLVMEKMSADQIETKATVVIATVKGDLHDIGKNLVSLQLSLNGYKVNDLGINVPTMDIINKAKEANAEVIALSSLLMVTMPYQAEVIRYLSEMGLRDKFKVIIGGGPTTREFAEQIGADGWAPNAVQAVGVVDNILG
ncbi:MAG: cobalamin-dependent protein [Deltaproteobacteria bacterium]|nr:cobalamin-dependent protein [Deltaproteobacteria bacterium]